MTKTLDEIYKLCEENPVFKKYKSRKKENSKGSTLNGILTDIENWVTYCIYNRMVSKGYLIDTLCHDGCMIRYPYNEEIDDFEEKENYISKETIDDIISFVLKETGYKIQLEIKPFDNSIDLNKLKGKDMFDEIPDDSDLLDLFYQLKGQDVVVCNSGKIYIFNGDKGLWEKCLKNSLGCYICRFLSDYFSKNLSNMDLLKDLQKKLKKSCSIESLGRLYFNDGKYKTNDSFIDELNSLPYLIPFKDKVIDIRNRKIRKLVREDYFSFTIDRNLEFDPPKKCIEKVEDFIKSFFMVPSVGESGGDNKKYILDMDTYNCFKSILGYSMTGYINNKCLFFLIGESNSGKSTLIRIIEKTLNSKDCKYILPVHKRLFIGQQNNIEAEFGLLEGNLRMGHCSEFSDNDKLNGDLVKKITGGDSITYRPFNSDMRTIDGVKTKFFVSTNEFPKFKTYDSGLDTRLIYVPFKNKFDPISGSVKVEKFMEKYLDTFFTFLVEQACLFYKGGMKIKKSKNMMDIKHEIKQEKNVLCDFFDLFIENNGPLTECIPNWKLRELYIGRFPDKELTQKQFDLYAKQLFTNHTSTDRMINGKRTRIIYKYKLLDYTQDLTDENDIVRLLN